MAENKLVLGIDLEGMSEDLVNNGVNLKLDRVTEVGAVLWDFKGKKPLQILSELIDEPDCLPITKEIEDLTGINNKMLKDWGLKGDQTKMFLRNVASFMNRADYIMAHNGTGYDYPMLKALFERYEIDWPTTTWIDTMFDIEYPSHIQMRSMWYLEHAHGFINPFPHRAVTDVLAMLKIASQYDLDRMAAMAESPNVTIVANLKAPNWKNSMEVKMFNKVKNKVSKAKFRWSPEDKLWTKTVQKILLDEKKINFDFDWYMED
jgi:DNA polymerase III subunit epsilon